MNKSELVNEVSRRTEMTKAQVEKGINALISIITKTLKKGDKLTLVGFGTFKVVQRKARTGRNPKTGAQIKIAKKRVPKFTASKEGIWLPPHKK